jgi:hypothetical protein
VRSAIGARGRGMRRRTTLLRAPRSTEAVRTEAHARAQLLAQRWGGRGECHQPVPCGIKEPRRWAVITQDEPGPGPPQPRMMR